MSPNRSIPRSLMVPLLVPVFLLLVPLVAMQFTAEVNWTAFDFVAAYILLSVPGVVYKLVTRRAATFAYRAGAGLALVTGLLLTWINLAVGVIGDRNPANALYFGVLAVGLFGALLARLRPRGMAGALFATAGAQLLVPLIALFLWSDDFSPGPLPVVFLNACFAALFAGAGLLFLHAARQAVAER